MRVADPVGTERKGLTHGWYNGGIEVATLLSWGRGDDESHGCREAEGVVR
jgi:hypothetical protein